MKPEHVDVLVVGAGISGVAAAHHLRTECPGKSFLILEARDRMGGTWDLFRYPGVRSDSDMYTLGYSFRPWTDRKAIAAGDTILQYLKDTVADLGIERNIRYGCRVRSASWSSADSRWTVSVEDAHTGAVTPFTCSFLFVCAGYYDYAAGHRPRFEGEERYRGLFVHPQAWPESLDYEGKRIVVIGSGATAVTLVPELAKRAAHVTMLQRSPTYIVTAPSEDPVAKWLGERVPAKAAHALTRWKNVLGGMVVYHYCRLFPGQAKSYIVSKVQEALGGAGAPSDFTPSYDPWDQRLCLVPDGDLFAALRAGMASVVTGRIASFTETGIALESGKELEADVVVTATGLVLRFLGGMELEVDGKVIPGAETMTYKGMMCSGVPNMAFSFGYTNASWTLKCELTSQFVCRLLNHMDKNGYTECRPLRKDDGIEPELLIDFSSGYVQRGIGDFPRQGSAAPWRLFQNYALDLVSLRHSPLEDGSLIFSGRDPAAPRRPAPADSPETR